MFYISKKLRFFLFIGLISKNCFSAELSSEIDLMFDGIVASMDAQSSNPERFITIKFHNCFSGFSKMLDFEKSSGLAPIFNCGGSMTFKLEDKEVVRNKEGFWITLTVRDGEKSVQIYQEKIKLEPGKMVYEVPSNEEDIKKFQETKKS